MQAKHWSMSALAVELKIDRRRVAAICEKLTPVSKTKRTKYYLMADVVNQLVNQGDDKTSISQEQLLAARAARKMKELELMKMLNELLPADFVELTLSRMVVATRTKILSIKHKLKAEFPEIENDVLDSLDGFVRLALEELSSEQLPDEISQKLDENLEQFSTAS